ncbi:MAG: tyrosinase family protein [Acidiferrobacterales bacterium]|nr:tyrosinase family protein [Acidiferrobacterales bacterium]
MKKIACRKNLVDLSDAERDALVNAFLSLKSDGGYDKYSDHHDTYFGSAHGNPFFYPWHRKFLSDLEKDLQNYNADIALPYWDSTQQQSTSALPWTSGFMGGTGDPVSGPFAPWGIRRSLGASGSLPSAQNIEDDRDLTPYSDHWDPAEGRHGPPHNWVGGNMATVRSPEDPIFFLHHCFVDKWWSDWQLAHPSEAAYQGTGSESPGSAMPPWSTTPNDVIDSVDLDYIYDTDPSRIEKQTSTLNFIDIPEGEETVRGVVFDVITCRTLTFDITGGPGADFGTPFGTSVTVDPGSGAVRGEAIVWISYQGTTDGDSASGSVTIECAETGDSWVVPISANTVGRPTVGVALVLDKSGSMENDIGDGRSRNDLLVEAAQIFANVIQEDNGIGIAEFDHDAAKVMDIEIAGAPGSIFGTGRSEAVMHIANHTPNPDGYTSIGDGVEKGSELTAAASGFDETAMIVFTDGKENRSKYIADISGLINDKIFAIGLGTASDLNAAALNELCNGSGGELLLTDTIDPMDDFFKLSKYYLQVLAGITNVDIVADPEDWILPGEEHAIPFILNETDISHDVVLLCPAPEAVSMMLETPEGHIIDPAFAGSSIGVTHVLSPNLQYYRVTLPVVGPGGQASKEGTWKAILKVDDKHFKKYVGSLDNEQKLIERVLKYGIRYNLSVYSLSNLRLLGTMSQDSYQPGATLHLRCVLTEYGLPLAGQATIDADILYPDHTTTSVSMSRVDVGVYETTIAANLSGVYTAHAKAVGKTARGRNFTREHIFTGAVWKGGDNPAPTTPDPVDDPGRSVECLCKLLFCLMSDKVLTGEFRARLKKKGVNLDAIRDCVEKWCRCRQDNSANRRVQSDALLAAASELTTILADNPSHVSALREVLDKLER